MERDTADAILQLFTALTNWSQDHWQKLRALEQMLESHPEMMAEYRQKLETVRKEAASQKNSQSISKALDNLRAKLLRD